MGSDEPSPRGRATSMGDQGDSALRLDPLLSTAELIELGHIAYFLEQLVALRSRGALSETECAAITAEYVARRDTIEVNGRYEAALSHASKLRDRGRIDEAQALARSATRLSPDRARAWKLAIELLASAHRYAEALELASEAVGRVPELSPQVAILERAQAEHEERRQRNEKQDALAKTVADLIGRMRRAGRQGRHADVFALGDALLKLKPDDADALALLAHWHEQLGNIQRATAIYQELRKLEPGRISWRSQLARLEGLQAGSGALEDPEIVFLASHEISAEKPAPNGILTVPAGDRITWRTVAGEFLLEHWQKLILCLAVMLIVVSSTVGAHHLLGEQLLWSRAGQCLLALLYTATFTAFGTWLVRWGASRAGRIMLLTTLLVVPVNFSLAGELRLLSLPTVTHLAIFAMDVAVLMTLCAVVTWALGLEGGGFFALSFFTLGAFDATAARGVPFAWGLTALFASAVVFLASIWGLVGRLREGEPTEERRDGAYFSLGLLTYAYLFFAYRSGVFVLQLIPRMPPLMAVPAMISAIACARVAHALPRLDKDHRRVLLLQVVGLALAGTSFALALARPPIASALFSGNALLTSVLGFVLFVASLRAYRKPTYLYLACGALVATYFGAFDFFRHVMDQFLLAAGHALGYRGKLPPPFRAINGVVFNVALVALASFFERRWDDRRLAGHCHRIGLPLSVAACLFSAFEPLAALICLSAYSILYALAAWYFARPKLIYLACVSSVGFAAAWAWLAHGLSTSQWALGAAGIGLAFWLISRVVSQSAGQGAYRKPLLHATLAVAVLALVTSASALSLVERIELSTLAAILTVVALGALLARDMPSDLLAYFTMGAGAVGYLLCCVYLTRVSLSEVSAARWAVLCAAAGVGLVSAAEVCKRIGKRASDRLGRASAFRLYNWPMVHIGLFQVGLAVLASAALIGLQFEGPSARELGALMLALALSAAALALVSVFACRVVAMAAMTLVLATGAYSAGVLAGLQYWGSQPLIPGMAVAFGALALVSALAGPWLVHGSTGSSFRTIYQDPVRFGGYVVAGLTWAFAVAQWDSHFYVTIALTLAGMALIGCADRDPVAPVTLSAVASFLGVWLSVFELEIRGAIASPGIYALVLSVFALMLLALAERLRGRELARERAFAQALPDFAILVTLAVIGVVARGMHNGLSVIVALFLTGCLLLWLTRFRARQDLIYASIVSVAASALCSSYWISGDRSAGFALGWLAATAAVSALVLWIVGFLCRRRGQTGFYDRPCFQMILPLAFFALFAALTARLESVAVTPLTVAAFLITSLALGLLATTWRTPALVYGAIATFVVATYVIVLSLGDRDPTRAWILGLVAVVEAILFEAIALSLVRFRLFGLARFYAGPLQVCSLVLMVLAVPLSYSSPLTMALVGIACLLMIKGLPAVEWIYAAAAAFGVAIYFGFLADANVIRGIWAAVFATFFLWLTAAAAQRGRLWLCRRLGLEDLKYDVALYNSALVAMALGIALRFEATFRLGAAWDAYPGLPLALAILSLLMLRPYAHRLWVDAAVGLLTFSTVAIAHPWIVGPHWLAFASATSLAWLAAYGILRLVEGPYCERFGFRQRDLARVLEHWSLGLFAVASSAVALWVGAAMIATIVPDWARGFEFRTGWSGVFLALVLVVIYLDVASRSSKRAPLSLGLLFAAPLFVWWLGVSTSPLVQTMGLNPHVYLPLSTVAVALGLAAVSHALGGRGDAPADRLEVNAGWNRRAWLGAHAWRVSAALACVALVLTFGRIGETTVFTLMLSSLIFALLAFDRRAIGLACAAAVTWVAVAPFGLLAILSRWGIVASAEWANAATLAGLSAAFALMFGAGWFRRAAEGQGPERFGYLVRLAEVLEGVALSAIGVGLAVAIAIATGATALGGVATYSGIGVFTTSAAMLAVYASHRSSEWPVYGAQVLLLGSYAYYRAANPVPTEVDALVVVFLGYLDFAFAELMQRLRLRLYTRPMLNGSLVLPVLPLFLAIWGPARAEAGLRILFLAATFYALACTLLGRKRLGYVAALLYNAFLWVLWAHAGWRLVEEPHFFLIPVGFSIILFAEVNRRDLGRLYVQAIRSLGLVIVYASLAYPVVQSQSFGAWVSLFLLSLLGVFVGIALRAQSFLWLGLAGFFLDVVYQLGRMGMENSLAKWGIMLALGISLVMFVAVNEKKRVVARMREYYKLVRQWD
jgi:tetratricopeptide (TPR) repeat protein